MARKAKAVVCRQNNVPVAVEEIEVESPHRGAALTDPENEFDLSLDL